MKIKRLLGTLVLVLILSVVMTGCGEIVTSNSYKISFVQNGFETIEKTVNTGEAFTDIPTTQPKTGYTVTWEITDFSSINEDIIVNAVETPNKYIVTYDANGGEATSTTDEFTFDSAYTLKTPTRAGFTFVCWKNIEQSLTQTGTWKIAEDVTLTAEWAENAPTEAFITFVQNGQQNVVKSVTKGAELTDIPTPIAKTGYDIVWDRTDFTNITANLTVNAVETAKKYTVTYDAKGGEVTPTSEEFTFDATYSLKTPTREGYTFAGWKNGEQTLTLTGTWKIAEAVTLSAEWTAKEFTITYITDKSDAVITATTQKVSFGTAFTLYEPTCNGYDFGGWEITGTTEKFTEGTWNRTSDISLTAIWNKDDVDSGWTDWY